MNRQKFMKGEAVTTVVRAFWLPNQLALTESETDHTLNAAENRGITLEFITNQNFGIDVYHPAADCAFVTTPVSGIFTGRSITINN